MGNSKSAKLRWSRVSGQVCTGILGPRPGIFSVSSILVVDIYQCLSLTIVDNDSSKVSKLASVFQLDIKTYTANSGSFLAFPNTFGTTKNQFDVSYFTNYLAAVAYYVYNGFNLK